VSRTRWFLAPALAVAFLGGGGYAAVAAEGGTKPAKDVVSFGALRCTPAETARSQALDWLKGVGKADDATLKQFDAIWASDRPTLDKVADTLALGDPQAKKLLDEARDPAAVAPTTVPAILKDAKKPAFYRANLAVAYAKALSAKRVYEEGLEALKQVKAEQTVDPSSYLFHKAVAEHSLMLQKEADATIIRLLDDVVDAPERHQRVALLMHADMQNWREKDLGWIKRKMDNIERRLDLARGGPRTQKIQKEVVARLDELIKQLENQQKGDGRANDGNCPPGGQPGPSGLPRGIRSTRPAIESAIAPEGGPGHVDPRRFKEIAEVWGKLPERERARAVVELTRDLPPRYREYVENYFRKLAESNPK